MSLRFIPPEYDGGRILAISGRVDVGAVFPNSDGSATWAFWLGGRTYTHIKARSVLAAKGAVLAKFRDWLRLADMAEASHHEHEGTND